MTSEESVERVIVQLDGRDKLLLAGFLSEKIPAADW